jgi:hypothetical protein
MFAEALHGVLTCAVLFSLLTQFTKQTLLESQVKSLGRRLSFLEERSSTGNSQAGSAACTLTLDKENVFEGMGALPLVFNHFMAFIQATLKVVVDEEVRSRHSEKRLR